MPTYYLTNDLATLPEFGDDTEGSPLEVITAKNRIEAWNKAKKYLLKEYDSIDIGYTIYAYTKMHERLAKKYKRKIINIK